MQAADIAKWLSLQDTLTNPFEAIDFQTEYVRELLTDPNGRVLAAAGMSSKPMMATSPGTLSPASALPAATSGWPPTQ